MPRPQDFVWDFANHNYFGLTLFGSRTKVREVSLLIAVAEVAYRAPPTPTEDVRSRMFQPVYRDYTSAGGRAGPPA